MESIEYQPKGAECFLDAHSILNNIYNVIFLNSVVLPIHKHLHQFKHNFEPVLALCGHI